MFSGETQEVKLKFHCSLVNAVIDRFGKNITLRPDGDECFLHDAWKTQKEDLLLTLKYIQEYYKAETKHNSQNNVLFVEAQIDKVDKKLKNLINIYTDGDISKEEFQSMCKSYDDELVKLKEQKDSFGKQQETVEKCMCDMSAIANVLKSAVKAFLNSQRNKKPKIYKGKQSVKHLMLMEYAKLHDLPCPKHFTDDGISGTRFDRPGFVAMMEEVNKGLVEAIVVKDMSRTGRDYLVVGQYMELLRQKGVRLIAINDGVDSFKSDVPMSFNEAVELTPEEQAELKKREERKDRLHRNYLKRKEQGKVQQDYEKSKAKKKQAMDEMKNKLRAEDIEKGIFTPKNQLSQATPTYIGTSA